MTSPPDAGLRRAVGWVIILNLGYFAIEFSVATAIGSVSLFADSVDFLEDTAVNLLVLLPRIAAPGLDGTATRNARRRTRLSAACSRHRDTLDGVAQAGRSHRARGGATHADGMGALAINTGCALLLARWRAAGGSLTRAAFLSARNDAIANVAIAAAGVLTAVTHSLLPDLIVGLGIFVMNLDAAR